MCALRLIVTLALIAGLLGCESSEPGVPRIFYFDPPNEPVTQDMYRVRAAHQYLAPLTPNGPSTEGMIKYRGEPVAYHLSAWNPKKGVIYTTARIKGEPWVVQITVPGLDVEPLARVPKTPRGKRFTPQLAYDHRSGRLVAADHQHFCGAKLLKPWHVLHINSRKWQKGSIEKHAFATLDYYEPENVFVGVGLDFAGEGSSKVVAKVDPSGNVVSQVEADVCSVLKPRSGFDRQWVQSQIVGDKVQIIRHLYYGRDAEQGKYWERQLYEVDVNTGEVRRLPESASNHVAMAPNPEDE